MTIGLSKLLVNCFAQSSINFNLNVNTASVEAVNRAGSESFFAWNYVGEDEYTSKG